MDNDSIEFQKALVVELEESLKDVGKMNYIAVTESQFKRDFFPTLYQVVTNPNADVRSWVGLVGNMYARVKVVSDDKTKVVYDIPPILSQGHTASPDPEAMSLNDLLDHTSSMRDTLPELAINQKHNVYAEHSDVLERNNYEDTRQEAGRTVETINRIFTDYGYEKIPVPVGLDDPKPVETTPAEKVTTREVPTIEDFDDGEML